MKTYNIRIEQPQERREVENLIRESFWNVYRPGCLEHYVMHCLRNDKDFIADLNFVMTVTEDGKERLIGQAMCMKAQLTLDSGGVLPIMTLGPIGIHPDYKRQGYGKALLDFTLEKAAAMGFGAVCFEGNIDFYGKSGFTFASAYNISIYY